MTTQVDPTGQSSQSQGAEQSNSGYADNLGELIQKLIQLNIWVYRPPLLFPTNGQVNGYNRQIEELTLELSQRLSKTVGGHDV